MAAPDVWVKCPVCSRRRRVEHFIVGQVDLYRCRADVKCSKCGYEHVMQFTKEG